jgi:hypothetical protein
MISEMDPFSRPVLLPVQPKQSLPNPIGAVPDTAGGFAEVVFV